MTRNRPRSRARTALARKLQSAYADEPAGLNGTNFAAFELAPDWVCEVVSPSTAALDRTDKMPFYGASGIGHAWLVDPLAQPLEGFRRDGGLWVLLTAFKDDARVRAEPFDAIELDLSALWAR